MEIRGYKCFNKDKTNRYGMFFQEGKKYSVDGVVSFGNNGNGFHFCENLSDVFRFFDVLNGNYTVASVIGSGVVVKRDDEFYGYYDMFSCSDIYIEKFLTRDEIIEKMLSVNSFVQLRNFLVTFPLNEDEKYLFYSKVKNNKALLLVLLYYQFGLKDIYYNADNMMLEEVKKLGKVIDNGQDSNKRSKGK